MNERSQPLRLANVSQSLQECVFTVTFSCYLPSCSCVYIAVELAALSQDDEVSANCPNDSPYTTVMKFFNGTCYQFVSQEKYWPQARDFCLLVDLRNHHYFCGH